ncbi:alkaline phosphatase family protein [Candidatus Methylomirabilis sp.]|uniref:alkaline phosphatase family protein n=1 Tax=Candidatus Methylomirabilis sp. TaxID=2032687 RepID=UPI003075F7D9
MKVAVLGLDCATPQLVFDQFKGDLPNLSRLMAEGVYGELESTHPPITVPAWSCMMSGRDPGELGCYGFRNRKDYSYNGYSLANSTAIREPLIWDYLQEQGLRSILLGVPQTYPPRPIMGEMVTCFLTPSTQNEYTHPTSLKEEIERVSGGYILDVEDFRTDNKQAILDQIFEMTRRRFRVAKHLIAHHPWDFFMMVEMGVDRIHHGFWKYFDKEHPKYEPGNPFENAIREYYQFVDQEIGEVLSLLGQDCAVMVVSDHGAKKMVGGICFNEWLMKQGYLRLKEIPSKPTPFSKVEIDWDHTLAWGEGGYYGRLFLNVKGREPRGRIEPGEYEKVRDRMIADIQAIEDPAGRMIGSIALRPEDLYRATRGIPPDLVVYFGNLDWRSVGSVGYGSIHTFDNDTGPDDANHAQHGIFILRVPDRTGGHHHDGLRIYDVAPTILDLFGIPTPEAMHGKMIR